MSAKVFDPENRLASLTSNPEAPLFEHLVLQAEQRAASAGADMRGELERAVESVLAYRELAEETLFGECLQVASKALAVAEIAAFAGSPAVGRAAAGLYEMIELLVERGAWHTGALALHLEALRTLSGAAAEPAKVERTLEELRQMRTLLAQSDAPH